MRLKDKVAIVTGASQGIGRSIAIALAREGARIVVNELGEPGRLATTPGDQVVEEIKRLGAEAMKIDADVSRKDQVDVMIATAVERLGGIDVLVNNAGLWPPRPFLDVTEELWDQVVDINLKGVFLCTQAAAKVMVKQGRGGRIINISSISSIVGREGLSHYCASKAGVNLFTKAISLELGPLGITCNCILPGLIETPMTRELLADERLKNYLTSITPVRRVGQPDDIAGLVVFLASEEASFITGATFTVDGGMTTGLSRPRDL